MVVIGVGPGFPCEVRVLLVVCRSSINTKGFMYLLFNVKPEANL